MSASSEEMQVQLLLGSSSMGMYRFRQVVQVLGIRTCGSYVSDCNQLNGNRFNRPMAVAA